MRRILVALALYALMPTALVHPADVRISPTLNWNGESNLVVDPHHPDRMVVGWMSRISGRTSIATSRSLDGGLTWSAPVALPHMLPGQVSADPTFVWLPDGTVIAGYVDYDNVAFSTGGLYVCRSTDGVTWDTPSFVASVATPDRPVDRPWLVYDSSNGPHAGRLYAVTKKQVDAVRPFRLYLTWSDDRGHTWTPQKTIDDAIPVGANLQAMAVPGIAADGTLRIAYLSYDPASALFPRYVVLSSSDGGVTLVPRIAAVLPANAGLAATDTLYQYSFTLGCHPRAASIVTLAWTDARNGDPDIYGCTSMDGGVTWNAPVRVNDDPLGNGVGQDMVSGAWAPNGAWALAWRDRRESGTGQSAAFKVYGARSLNSGNTWPANVAVSASPSPGIVLVNGNDFLGIAHTDTALTSTWADARLSGLSLQLYSNHARLAPVTLTVPDVPPITTPRLVLSADRKRLAVTFVSWCDGTIEVSAWDIAGRRVGRSLLTPGRGADAHVEFPSTALPSGVYLISASGGGTRARARALLLR